MELKQGEKMAQPGNNGNTHQVRYKGEKKMIQSEFPKLDIN